MTKKDTVKILTELKLYLSAQMCCKRYDECEIAIDNGIKAIIKTKKGGGK